MSNYADKQGNTQISDTQRAVCALVSTAIFGGEPDIPGDADWNAIFTEVCRHAVAALTFSVASGTDVPKDLLDRWACERDKYIMKNIRNFRCHYDIHKLLSDADIPYVILKGVASGSYYPDCLMRAYGDVDFLVEAERYEEVAAFLKSKGFEYEEEHDFHKRFQKGGMRYELHIDVPGLPLNDIADLVRDSLSDIMDAAVSFGQGSDVCNIPCDRHHALILLLHTANHMRNEGVGLRHLCDWAAFAGNMNDEFFESEMQDTLSQIGLWHFAKLLTAVCSRYLGLREFSFAKIDDSDYLDAFAGEFISSGNFGIDRSREEIVGRSGNAYTAINNMSKMQYIIRAFNNSSIHTFPVVQRKPILMPAAWVYVGTRHIVRMITGERSMEFTKTMLTEDAARREFVEKWQLFEPQQ